MSMTGRPWRRSSTPQADHPGDEDPDAGRAALPDRRPKRLVFLLCARCHHVADLAARASSGPITRVSALARRGDCGTGTGDRTQRVEVSRYDSGAVPIR